MSKYLFFCHCMIIGFGITPSCKSSNDKPSLMNLHGCSITQMEQCPEIVKNEMSRCQEIPLATWNQATGQCNAPQSNRDCQTRNNTMIWNGYKCVTRESPKTFYQYCLSTNISEDVKHTMTVLMNLSFYERCQEVFDDLFYREEVVLHSSQIKNLEPLRGLIHLRLIDLYDNNIEDVKPLSELPRLETLRLGKNRLNDQSIQLLAKMPRLKELALFENGLTDISPLKSATNLRYLDVERNQIESFEGFSKESFEEFFVANNPAKL